MFIGEQKDIATEMWGSISGAFSSVAESSKRGFAGMNFLLCLRIDLLYTNVFVALSDKSKDSDLGHKIQQGASKGWGAMSDFFTSGLLCFILCFSTNQNRVFFSCWSRSNVNIRGRTARTFLSTWSRYTSQRKIYGIWLGKSKNTEIQAKKSRKTECWWLF